MNNYRIRPETPADYAAAEHLTREAFWNVYRPGCVEHFVLHQARGTDALVPALTCVLETEQGLAGHILYCRAAIQTADGTPLPILTFGPVSVLPPLQRKGLGAALIRHTLEKAAALGFGAVAIVGDPAYYGRFGFVAGSSLGVRYVHAPADDPFPFFMVKELRAGYLDGVTGVYADPPVYQVEEDAVQAFDRDFPEKRREKRAGQLL